MVLSVGDLFTVPQGPGITINYSYFCAITSCYALEAENFNSF